MKDWAGHHAPPAVLFVDRLRAPDPGLRTFYIHTPGPSALECATIAL